MIKIRIKSNDKETDIRFPISENSLYQKLSEIQDIEDKSASQSAYITHIYWPEELSTLENHLVNLDEINYLAKRLYSFDEREMDQFLLGIKILGISTAKDFINLTFNLDRFTLVQDISNYGKIGRAYVLNTEGCIPAYDENDPKYAALGKDLIERGLTQITERGLLIYDPSEELKEEYDGHVFPEYYYRSDFLVSVELDYNGRRELLLLPDEDIAIRKAGVRLGAPSIEDCAVGIDSHTVKNDALIKRIQDMINKKGIYETNDFLKAINTPNMNLDKLESVIEFMSVENTSAIVALAERLDDFDFIPKVNSEQKLAYYFVDYIND